MITGWIYIIKNTVNNKVYVGQTHMTVRLRFQDHLSAARHGKDYVIGKAIRKYGEDKFYVIPIDTVIADSEKELTKLLNVKETYWINFFDSTNTKYGYNMSIGGNVVRTTKKLNEQQVLELFSQGNTSCGIAKILHVCSSRIAKILQKNNIVYGVDKQRRSDEKEVITSYLDGIGTMDICRKYNINKTTVRGILLRNNITLRCRAKNKNSERNPQTLNTK
jgi:group I intron endonuclease